MRCDVTRRYRYTVCLVVNLRFYAELNDFLAADRRQRDCALACAADVPVRQLIESCGVPHTEVALILVNGDPVGFDRRLCADDRVAVYPAFLALGLRPPLPAARFVADAHLGALARLMRLAGFDTVYGNRLADAEIERLAEAEGRVVLTRDRDLLKRRAIAHGCHVHAQQPDLQLRETVARLDLARSAQPFSRCLVCNAGLLPVASELVRHTLPERVRDRMDVFHRCPGCQRVYWQGSHWRRMRERLQRALAGVGAATAAAAPAAAQPATASASCSGTFDDACGTSRTTRGTR
ncbi:MAG: Mut7-C ubiquitin/RNAse domain-containing protein [Candidatus Accumulibacter sp.]|nr:Mut7-C RNAse domain-containing protein [Accumulibacter sp.]MCM8612239.1 Mut7-C ubiquitin/RNAse domain-containing protein [Accumulibacter sp.]MCM8635912.1 Mut7-C ubiquitin/RNAse domain-containing protein [Accumulibacter sp.]MCM8639479.1 Mut7-C ubiquitin/RNAse domain-containing protein [Accumulibacter sp.]